MGQTERNKRRQWLMSSASSGASRASATILAGDSNFISTSLEAQLFYAIEAN